MLTVHSGAERARYIRTMTEEHLLLNDAGSWSNRATVSNPPEDDQRSLSWNAEYDIDGNNDESPRLDPEYLPDGDHPLPGDDDGQGLVDGKSLLKSAPCPKFVALSYASGDDMYSNPILLQNCTFQLRKNLHEFLQEYTASANRRGDPEDGTTSTDEFIRGWGRLYPIWIDVAERSKQVQIMSNIYTQATMVIAWLGTAADDSDWCLEEVAGIGRQGNISLDNINHERSQYTNALGLRLRDGVRAILRRPLFSRVWCVQEMVLPPKVVLMCGAKTVDWDKLQAVADLFTFDFYTDYSRLETLRPIKSDTFGKYPGFFEHAFETPGQDTRTEQERNTTRKLGNLLHCFIGRQCTIKHDYIYALIGIASDFDPMVGSGLTIDYTMPVEDLFDEVITFCVLRYELDGLFIRKLARAMELSETKMEKVMRKTQRIISHVKPDGTQLHFSIIS